MVSHFKDPADRPERRTDRHLYLHLLVRQSRGITHAQTDISRFADKFGRKKSFYLAWIWLVVVGDLSQLTRRDSHLLGMRLPEHRQVAISLGKSFEHYSTAVC